MYRHFTAPKVNIWLFRFLSPTLQKVNQSLSRAWDLQYILMHTHNRLANPEAMTAAGGGSKTFSPLARSNGLAFLLVHTQQLRSSFQGSALSWQGQDERKKSVCASQKSTVCMRAMRFRPCIDLHDGRVKQIVGGSLNDSDKNVETNFETEESAAHFANLYRRDRLPGGHVIMLGPGNEAQAISALNAFPDGLHVGGGIHPGNAGEYLSQGASHVIVTSYVFRDGEIDWSRVQNMISAVGKERLVLDVSCRKRDRKYIVCTDRWQKWTDVEVDVETVGRLADVCDQLLIHAVDVEGKRDGIDVELIENLGQWAACPITYAGGVRSLFDLDLARDAGRSLIDVTIGSALDIFGGSLRYSDAVEWQRKEEKRAQ